MILPHAQICLTVQYGSYMLMRALETQDVRLQKKDQMFHSLLQTSVGYYHYFNRIFLGIEAFGGRSFGEQMMTQKWHVGGKAIAGFLPHKRLKIYAGIGGYASQIQSLKAHFDNETAIFRPLIEDPQPGQERFPLKWLPTLGLSLGMHIQCARYMSVGLEATWTPHFKYNTLSDIWIDRGLLKDGIKINAPVKEKFNQFNILAGLSFHTAASTRS